MRLSKTVEANIARLARTGFGGTYARYREFRSFLVELLSPIDSPSSQWNEWLELLRCLALGTELTEEEVNAVKQSVCRFLVARNEAMFNKVQSPIGASAYILLFGLYRYVESGRPELDDPDSALADICEKYLNFLGGEDQLLPALQRLNHVSA
jgi:hypothetical protein